MVAYECMTLTMSREGRVGSLHFDWLMRPFLLSFHLKICVLHSGLAGHPDDWHTVGLHCPGTAFYVLCCNAELLVQTSYSASPDRESNLGKGSALCH